MFNNLSNKLDSIYKKIVVHHETETEKIMKANANTSRRHAEMESVIRSVKDPFIKQQLEYRYANGNYFYEDLVDQKQIKNQSNDTYEITV